MQLEGDKRDKSTVLLGILIEKMREFPAMPDTEQIASWKQIGLHTFKKYQAQRYRHD